MLHSIDDQEVEGEEKIQRFRLLKFCFSEKKIKQNLIKNKTNKQNVLPYSLYLYV